MALFLLLPEEEDRRLLLLKDEAIDRRGVLRLEGDANDDGAASEDLAAAAGLSPNDARRGVVSRFNRDGFLGLGDLGGRDSTCGVTDRRLLTLVDILCVWIFLERVAETKSEFHSRETLMCVSASCNR
jgi:hypothetical protein